MLTDGSRRDFVGRLLSLAETAPPLLVMSGIVLVVLLVILGLMRKHLALLFIVLAVGAFSGVRNESLDSALTLVRWMGIIILALSVVYARQHPGLPLLMYLIFVLMGLGFSGFSPTPSWSIQTGVLFLATTTLGITAASIMSDRAGLRRFFWLFLGPSLIWAAFAFWYLPDFLAGTLGFGRFAAYYDTSSMFAITGTLVLPCLLWQTMQPVRLHWRILSGMCFIAVCVLLLLTTQRSPLLAGIVSCVPLLLSMNVRNVVIAVVVTLGAWLAISQLWQAMNDRQSEYIVARLTDTSTANRFQLWKDSMRQILDDPIVGHGFGSDRSLAQGAHLSYKQRPHNWYIVSWHNTGIFGLLLLLAALGMAILSVSRVIVSDADRELKDMSRLVLGELLGSMTSGLVVTMASPSNLETIVLVLFLAASGRIATVARQEREWSDELELQEELDVRDGHLAHFHHSYG